MKTVAIVGTGLIGASFGLALRQAGFDGDHPGVSSPRAIAGAMAAGAIDRGAPLAEAVAQADLVFLSQTIGRILDTIRHLDPLVRPDALVTDAGSTKCEIVDLARQSIARCQFLGGHPMAGKETRGAAAADGGLFRGRTWALTPDEPAELETPAARDFRGWLERIGARIMVLDADEHDRVVALTSHLPQLASTALAATVAERMGASAALADGGPRPGRHDPSGAELLRSVARHSGDQHRAHRARLGRLHSKAGAHAREPSDAAASRGIRARRRHGGPLAADP